MTVVLNKIDPVIVNNVHQQTAEGVIHTSEKTRVSKDGKQKKDNQPSNKRLKEKIDKVNAILAKQGKDISFMIDGDYVNAVDGDKKVIKSYTKEAAVQLFDNIKELTGIFIDIKK